MPLDKAEYFRGSFSLFQDYRSRGILCDAILSVGDKFLKAHSIVLAAGSSIFKEALEANDINGIKYIQLPDGDFETIEIAVNFMYSGNLVVMDKYKGNAQKIEEIKESLKSLGIDSELLENCTTEYERSSGEKTADTQQGIINSVTKAKKSSDSNLQSASNVKPNKTVESALTHEKSSALESVDLTDSNIDLPVMIKTENEAIDNSEQTFYQPISEQFTGEPVMIQVQREDGTMECSYVTMVEQNYVESVVQTTLHGGEISDQDYEQSINDTIANVVAQSATGNKRKKATEAVISKVLKGSSPKKGRPKKEAGSVGNVANKKGTKKQEVLQDDTDSSPEDGEVVENSNSTRCIECNIKFKTLKDLSRHQCLNHPTETKATTSKDSGTKAPTVLMDEDGKYVCSVCDERFQVLGELRKHQHSVHNIGNRFECSHCGSTFTTMRVLQTHIRSHTGERPVLCHLCGRSFTEVRLLKLHLKTPHEDLACHTCGKMCTSRGQLAVHSMAEHGIWIKARIDKPKWKRFEPGGGFLCDTCGKSFSTNSSRMTHHARAHRRACHVCGMRLESEELLKEHMTNAHAGIEIPKRNWCKGCDREFSSATAYHEHMLLHTNERPFKCVRCNRCFVARSRLVMHLQKEHGCTGENIAELVPPEVPKQKVRQRFPCGRCNQVFDYPHTLAAHTATHTGELPFKCKYCLKRFLYKASLYAHVRIHTGELPFSCHICGKKFRQGSHLKRHVNMHSGEKQHICELCGKGYMGKVDLRYHYTKVHHVAMTTTRQISRNSYTFHLPPKDTEVIQ